MNESFCNEACDIRIDKDGLWHYRGAEMFRKDIVRYLSDHVGRDCNGRYFIALENDFAFVDVEDTAFVVKLIEPVVDPVSGTTSIRMTLSDGSTEIMDPGTLRIGADNVPYCLVKSNSLGARLSRPSFYQLSVFIDFDEGHGYYLMINGSKHYILASGDEQLLEGQHVR